nr:8319_t:CDS:2 [Entrophospora candida]
MYMVVIVLKEWPWIHDLKKTRQGQNATESLIKQIPRLSRPGLLSWNYKTYDYLKKNMHNYDTERCDV